MDHPAGARLSWRTIAGWILSLVALAFVGRWLFLQDRHVWTIIRQLSWPPLAAGSGLFILWFFLRFHLWHLISRHYGATPSWAQNLRLWVLSEFSRYIPGNIWSFAARFQGTRDHGASAVGATSAVVTEALGLVSGALAVSGFWMPQLWQRITAPVLALVLTFLAPAVLRLVRARWPRFADLTSPSWIFGLSLLWRYALLWLVFGLANAAIVRAFPALPAIPLATIIGVSILAWLIGYLSIVTPMGLGVREVTFVSLLAATLTAPVASLLAVVSRLWLIISELVFIVIVLLWTRRKT